MFVFVTDGLRWGGNPAILLDFNILQMFVCKWMGILYITMDFHTVTPFVFLWFGAGQFPFTSFRFDWLALGQSCDCPSASQSTQKNMGKCIIWLLYERVIWPQQNEAQHNTTASIFHGIYWVTPGGLALTQIAVGTRFQSGCNFLVLTHYPFFPWD